MSKSSEELLSKLKTSLPKASAKPQPASTASESESREQPKPILPAARPPKLSVSLFQPDLHRMDAIKDFMKARGFRNVNDSEAIRLACRSVEIGDNLVGVDQAMQHEDGRRRPEIKKAEPR